MSNTKVRTFKQKLCNAKLMFVLKQNQNFVFLPTLQQTFRIGKRIDRIQKPINVGCTDEKFVLAHYLLQIFFAFVR